MKTHQTPTTELTPRPGDDAPIGDTRSIRELIAASAALRKATEAAIERSRTIEPAVRHNIQTSLGYRLASRAHLLYARVEGVIDGQPEAAVVRTTGEVAASRALLSRAQVVVLIGDSFDNGRITASLDAGPVASTLTCMRAMDRVEALNLALPVVARPVAKLP